MGRLEGPTGCVTEVGDISFINLTEVDEVETEMADKEEIEVLRERGRPWKDLGRDEATGAFPRRKESNRFFSTRSSWPCVVSSTACIMSIVKCDFLDFLGWILPIQKERRNLEESDWGKERTGP